jgi:hypothetical protein
MHRAAVKKVGILLNAGVGGVLKREIAVILIKCLIGFFRVDHAGVGAGFGSGSRFVASGKQQAVSSEQSACAQATADKADKLKQQKYSFHHFFCRKRNFIKKGVAQPL